MSYNLNQEISSLRTCIEKINTGNIKDGYFNDSPPYLFSTENLKDSFDIFDFTNKDVLTVASSGDHAFDAYLRGARNVDTFDCSLLQKYITELKTTMIKRLTYYDFMEYFFDESQRMNSRIISKIIPKLSLPAQLFFQEFEKSPNKDFFFHGMPFWRSASYNKDLISYIQSKGNYDTLRRKLPDTIRFIQADVSEIPEKINSKYDIIHLSNIFMATPGAFKGTVGLDKFMHNVINPLIKNNLDPENGQIILSYIWGTSSYDICYNQEYNILQTFKQQELNKDNLTALTYKFESAKKAFQKDGIMVIQKGKRL